MLNTKNYTYSKSLTEGVNAFEQMMLDEAIAAKNQAVLLQEQKEQELVDMAEALDSMETNQVSRMLLEFLSFSASPTVQNIQLWRKNNGV
jgi:hypothetical protein